MVSNKKIHRALSNSYEQYPLEKFLIFTIYQNYTLALTHPRTGFIFRRIKSLFHHSNWQHIFLISFNGTSKRGVIHYNKKKNMIFWSNIANLHENSGISIIKSVANLKISWSFFIRKILRSTRTLDCDKYRLKSKGKFFSFCWAIFLYFSTPISWVMSYDKKCPRFVDPVRGWVKAIP